MNAPVRKLIARLVKNDTVWALCRPLIKVSDFLSYQREVTQWVDTPDPDKALFEQKLGKPVVRNGPFTGLQYPDFTSFGSSIYPKILGSYEREITDIVSEIIRRSYTEILDIGCAEGYYAVGFALKCPHTKVYAYDTDEQARTYAMQMSRLNGVTDRVSVEATCTSDTLKQFPFTGKGLVFCDCEGYEKILFNKDNLSNLRNCDLLIETHDFIDITISEYIAALFSNTHDLKVVRSLDDITKAKTYDYPEAGGLNIVQREKLYHEGRPHIMEWFWLKAK